LSKESKINRLFVAYKPANISSNRFLSKIKRRYNVKKAGFSGTLDPFAKGVLIIAFGQYTKLFNYLQKSPKRYQATIWLGAISPTLDIEKIGSIKQTDPLDEQVIKDVMLKLKGKISYLPPKYSAKKIDGKRAYELARDNKEFELKKIQSTIYDLKLISYMHPFITFDITISEGGYVRSIAQILLDKLCSFGTLSALERISEGKFVYQKESALNPLNYIDLPKNRYLKDLNDLKLGKKLKIEDFAIQDEGEYLLECDTMLSIISIQDGSVGYKLNGVKLC
jgi:tRNA pseudouridine55 synthase